jgi:hypothetical protein
MTTKSAGSRHFNVCLRFCQLKKTSPFYQFMDFSFLKTEGAKKIIRLANLEAVDPFDNLYRAILNNLISTCFPSFHV